MDNNVSFRQDLIISYLNQLISSGYDNDKVVFDRYFAEIEDYLKEAMNKSDDVEYLNMIRSILSFKMKSIGTK